MNRTLQFHGFAPIALQPASEEQAALSRAAEFGQWVAPAPAIRDVLLSVLAQHEERGRLLQSALLETERAKQTAAQHAAADEGASRRTADLVRTNDLLHQKLRTTQEQAESAAAEAATASRNAERAVSGLKAKLAATKKTPATNSSSGGKKRGRAPETQPAAASKKTKAAAAAGGARGIANFFKRV